MFGHFEVIYQGKSIFLGRNPSGKSVRFMQILLTYGEKGISRHSLISYLFQNEEVADISNNFRVVQHRMKKLLLNAGIKDTDFCISEAGVYRWNKEFPASTDVELFKQYCKEAQQVQGRDAKIELLYQAFQLYRGEFLEEAGAEEWAVIYSVHYKHLYFDVLRELLDLYREEKDYQKMLEVSRRASRLYPYDEWQAEVLESLMALGRSKEAFDIYNETVRMYRDELDLDIPERMSEQIYRKNFTIQEHKDMVNDVYNKLEASLKQGKKGASYLNQQNFADTFRLMMRLTDRSEQEMSVMLCELQEEPDPQKYSTGEAQETMETLKTVICETLRSEDCFTSYGPNEYLILLMGAGEDKSELVFQRINHSFRKRVKAWQSGLSYQLIPIESLHQVIRKGKKRK